MKKILNSLPFKIFIGLFRFIFYGFIILYASFTLFQKFSSNGNVLGFRIYQVATGSMEPVYNVGDIILIKEVDKDELKVGDDITYKGNKAELAGMIVTHRIIEIKEEDGKTLIQTQGVANEVPDPVIEYSQVQGKVVSKLWFLTVHIKVLQNQYVFFFCLFVPIVILITLDILDFIFNKDDGDEKES